MKRSMNVLFAVFCGVVGAGTIVALAVAWLVNDPEIAPGSMAREGERSHQLDLALRHSNERIWRLARLTEAVVSGDVCLAAAAREDRDLHDEGELVHLRRAFGGDSHDETFCRHMLARVATLLRHSPRQYRGVLPRLEAEFKQLYPLTNKPVVIRNPLPMESRREGCADPSAHGPVDPGFEPFGASGPFFRSRTHTTPAQEAIIHLRELTGPPDTAVRPQFDVRVLCR